MDTRKPIAEDKAALVHDVEFNAGQNYFTVGTEHGFAIWTSGTCEKYTDQDLGGVGTVTMMGDSQMLAITGKGSRPVQAPNKVAVWDCLKREQQALVTTSSPVTRVRFTPTHIAIVMSRKVNLYVHKGQIEKVAFFETANNPLGLACLGSTSLVIPGRTPGQIQIIELKNLMVNIIPAHTSPLQALSLSQDGSIIASASSTGTLVRLFSTLSCSKLGEFRRGVTPARVYSIAVSPSCTHLAVTSNSNTLHIFEIPQQGVSSRPASAASYEQLSSLSQSPEDTSGFQKWGGLAKLPFAPRVLSDVYSVASATFDPGKEDVRGEDASNGPTAPKGVVGWLDDRTVAIVNAGRDARYERYALETNDDGKRICFRVGWSRFMRPN